MCINKEKNMTERKIALVTGASRGIGLCCAKELAMSGCDFIINDISTIVIDYLLI